MLIDAGGGEILHQVSKLMPEGTWFPNLALWLDDFSGFGGLKWHNWTKTGRFYVCPGYGHTKSQKDGGGSSDYFCVAWGCEFTWYIWWTFPTPITSDLVTVNWKGAGTKFANNRWVIIKFTEESKQSVGWKMGKTWGLHLYQWYGWKNHNLGAISIILLLSQPGQDPPEAQQGVSQAKPTTFQISAPTCPHPCTRTHYPLAPAMSNCVA